MKNERQLGEVSFFTDYRGYGFIKSGKADYFVHTSAIHTSDRGSLDPGDRVEFTPRQGMKGMMAVDVRITQKAHKPNDDSDRWVIMKHNPFTPQDPVTDPNKFAGRRSHFHNAVDALYNAKNILVSGPRGIGKSSISYQLLYLAAGDSTLAERLGIDLGGEVFGRIVGDHRCTPGNTIVDVATSLLITLQESIGRSLTIKQQEREVSFDLKYFKLGSKETLEPSSTGDLATMFCIDVDRIFKSLATPVSGITFLIDEVDVLLTEVDLAPFLKAVVEKLRLSYHLTTSFIVSGVTGITTELLLQHPSAGRLFENLGLDSMSNGELGEIIDLCLQDTGVEVTDHAKNRIVGLANNFPQPVHLIGYHAFRLDADAYIDVEDVEKAKQFVVTDLKKQEFKDRFERLIQRGALEVLRAAAISKHETMNSGYFRRLNNIDQKVISRALRELQTHGIVDEQSPGIWRFQDPLFKVYLRIALGIDEPGAGRERGRLGRRQPAGRSRRSSRPPSEPGK